jgi:hypothetical protein
MRLDFKVVVILLPCAGVECSIASLLIILVIDNIRCSDCLTERKWEGESILFMFSVARMVEAQVCCSIRLWGSKLVRLLVTRLLSRNFGFSKQKLDGLDFALRSAKMSCRTIVQKIRWFHQKIVARERIYGHAAQRLNQVEPTNVLDFDVSESGSESSQTWLMVDYTSYKRSRTNIDQKKFPKITVWNGSSAYAAQKWGSSRHHHWIFGIIHEERALKMTIPSKK